MLARAHLTNSKKLLSVSVRVSVPKEALSMLYGLERFDQYTYGRKVIVQNDHKPLAAILSKPLSRAPKPIHLGLIQSRIASSRLSRLHS
jgi:hypothetical protein